MRRSVKLLETGFSPGEALSTFAGAHREAGAMASFTGRVRRDDDVHALELTHYAPLTLPGMEEIAERAAQRFALDGVLAWHRVGTMTPGTAIVVAAAAAPHRRAAFDACAYLMDHLKSAAWFWKRERRADGWHWITPRAEDHAALSAWG